MIQNASSVDGLLVAINMDKSGSSAANASFGRTKFVTRQWKVEECANKKIYISTYCLNA